MGKIIPFAVSILLTLASFAAAQSSGDVDIASGDGTNLRGTYYSPDRTGPAILLLHQCNLTRAAWRPLGAALAAAGLHALAVDLRGFGESGGKPTDDVGRRELAGKWSADVDSMLKFLVSQPGVDRTRLGVGGASCGVPLASALAAKNRDMKALLVMSGPANDDGIRHVARTPRLAVFGAAGAKDAGGFEGVRQLVEASANPASTLKTYPGTGHGVELFAEDATLIQLIASWFKTQLAG